MTVAWGVIALLTIGSIVIKAAGPVLLGGRPLPERLDAVVALLAPAVLAALVVVDTFADEDNAISIDERLAGLLAAGGAIAARLPLYAVIVIAPAVTAGLRALS